MHSKPMTKIKVEFKKFSFTNIFKFCKIKKNILNILNAHIFQLFNLSLLKVTNNFSLLKTLNKSKTLPLHYNFLHLFKNQVFHGYSNNQYEYEWEYSNFNSSHKQKIKVIKFKNIVPQGMEFQLLNKKIFQENNSFISRIKKNNFYTKYLFFKKELFSRISIRYSKFIPQFSYYIENNPNINSTVIFIHLFKIFIIFSPIFLYFSFFPEHIQFMSNIISSVIILFFFSFYIYIFYKFLVEDTNTIDRTKEIDNQKFSDKYFFFSNKDICKINFITPETINQLSEEKSLISIETIGNDLVLFIREEGKIFDIYNIENLKEETEMIEEDISNTINILNKYGILEHI